MPRSCSTALGLGKPSDITTYRSGRLAALYEWRVIRPEMTAGLPNHRFSFGLLVGRGFIDSYMRLVPFVFGAYSKSNSKGLANRG